MRISSLLFLSGISTTAFAQQKPVLITATDYKGSGVILEAKNTSSIPYTLVLTCTLQNMEPSTELPLRKVIEPAKKKLTLTRLTPVGQPYRYTYNYRYYLGNTISVTPAPDYVYDLPFAAGQEYAVMQGNNGAFSHLNKLAVDFSMPEGSLVCAARAGIVAEIKQDSNTGCPTASCKDLGNYIIIFHEDGTYATYVHFKQNGSLVQPGQQVAAGAPIGYSGNTGWSSGPHLHFEVDLPSEQEKITLPVKFRVGSQILGELQQGARYTR